MDDLDISSLKLIDTYGLDHDNWDESKSIVLSNIIYDLVDKKLVYFDSNLAVAYVKIGFWKTYGTKNNIAADI